MMVILLLLPFVGIMNYNIQNRHHVNNFLSNGLKSTLFVCNLYEFTSINKKNKGSRPQVVDQAPRLATTMSSKSQRYSLWGKQKLYTDRDQAQQNGFEAQAKQPVQSWGLQALPDPPAKPQHRTCPPSPSVDFQSHQRHREPWRKSPGDGPVPGHPSLFSAFDEQASPSKSLRGFLMLPRTYSHSPRNGQTSGKLPTSTTNQNKQKNRNPEETETMP